MFDRNYYAILQQILKDVVIVMQKSWIEVSSKIWGDGKSNEPKILKAVPLAI